MKVILTLKQLKKEVHEAELQVKENENDLDLVQRKIKLLEAFQYKMQVNTQIMKEYIRRVKDISEKIKSLQRY